VRRFVRARAEWGDVKPFVEMTCHHHRRGNFRYARPWRLGDWRCSHLQRLRPAYQPAISPGLDLLPGCHWRPTVPGECVLAGVHRCPAQAGPGPCPNGIAMHSGPTEVDGRGGSGEGVEMPCLLLRMLVVVTRVPGQLSSPRSFSRVGTEQPSSGQQRPEWLRATATCSERPAPSGATWTVMSSGSWHSDFALMTGFRVHGRPVRSPRVARLRGRPTA